MRNKRPLVWPAAEATIGDRPSRFPTRHRADGIAVRLLQIFGGRSKGGGRQGKLERP